ncbi:MAG TPA: VOC family protein [Burkholderiales bacterium]|nr:VOC family protein [Burkholderiales bacterium]
MEVQSYLFFDGRCEEALEFYSRAIDAEIETMMRFSQNPDGPAACGPDGAPMPPENMNKIMHAQFRVGKTAILASDGMCTGKPTFQGVSLAILVNDEDEAKRYFDALRDGGQVQMPLAKTFFSSAFGMVADRFGVSWMVVADE